LLFTQPSFSSPPQDHERPWYRVVLFPTIFWCLDASDANLQAVAAVGAAAGAVAVLGGAWSPLWLGVAWVCLLSLSTVSSEWLCYPWDCLLHEAGFLALFLPATWMMGLTAQHEPHPYLFVLFRLLLARLLVGMGKKKFSTGWNNPENRLYIKAFLAWQPVPTRLAYHMFHSLPEWFFLAALYSTYLIEIVLPVGIFLTPETAQIVGWLVISLQVGIHLSGNYGIFNILTGLLCLPLWDDSRSWVMLDLSLAQDLTMLLIGGGAMEASAASVLCRACLWLVTVGYAFAGLVYLPWDSFNTLTWLHGRHQRRAFFEKLPGGAVAVVVLRYLAPFRIWHAYGVFDAKAPDKAKHGYRVCAVIEASINGKQWALWPYKYGLGNPDTPPRHFAPYQPRIDHQMFYEGVQMRCCYFNYLNPYNSCKHLWAARFLARLLENEPAVTGFLGPNPYGEAAWGAAGDARVVRIAQYWCRWYSPAEMSRQRAAREKNQLEVQDDSWLLRTRMGTMVSYSRGQLKSLEATGDFWALPTRFEFSESMESWHLFHGQAINFKPQKKSQGMKQGNTGHGFFGGAARASAAPVIRLSSSPRGASAAPG